MINVGIVGVGYWGPNLIRNFIKNEDTNVSLICDLKKDRLSSMQRIYPFLTSVYDYREIISANDIDLVAVCTPVFTHYEIAKAALEANKHVLLTKPMTSSSIEAEDLVNIAAKKGLHIFVDHTFIYTGAVKKIKELIVNKEIGDLFYFDSVRINLGLFQHDVNVIWDLAPHDISIMQYFLNAVPEVIVATGADHFHNGLEDVAYLTAYFPKNLIAHIHVNWLSPVKIRQTLIAGSKKMIVWDDNEPSEKVRIYDKGVDVKNTSDEVYKLLIQYRTGDMHCPRIDNSEALQVEINHIVECIQQNKPAVTDGISGLNIVKVLEAAQASIKNHGKAIRL